MIDGRTNDPERLPLLMIVEDIVAATGASKSVVRRWLAEGRIPSTRLGKRRYVRREDFLAYFDPKKNRRRRRRS